MVKEDDLWPFKQNAAWHLPNLNHMNKLLPPSGQQKSLPFHMNPRPFSPNAAFPGFSVSALPGLKAGQANANLGLSHCMPSLLESTLPHGLGIKTALNDATGSIQKRFLIFDQSGSQTRMFFSPFVSSPHTPFVAPVEPARSSHLCDENQATKAEKISPAKGIIQDTSGENHIIGEGSEMHEDTEEIDALLYSDDDDDDDYDDEDDDEVTSTDHSPFAIRFEKEREITEQVACSGDPIKRQRLVDGGYKKSSLEDATSLLKLDSSCKYDSDAQSSCANGRIGLKKNVGSVLGIKRSRKDKINETLRILESIIPGSKSKDPLLVIDEAIDYLKSLKLKVKALGLSHP